MDEIVEMALSSGEAAQSVADHTKRRLENKSPIVKFKVAVLWGCRGF